MVPFPEMHKAEEEWFCGEVGGPRVLTEHVKLELSSETPKS